MDTRVSQKALTAMFLIGFISLPIIGGIEFVRFARARPASNEGWIAYAIIGGDGIWVMDANGKNQRQLTADEGDSRPVWSPDGQQIAFDRRPDNDPDSRRIYIMNADGSNVRQVTDGWSGESDIYSRWSPDGKQIAFTRAIREGGTVLALLICVVNPDGSNLRRLTAESTVDWDSFPSWSPDGTKIAFNRDTTEGVPFAGGRASQIWTMDSDGNNQRMLKDFPFSSPLTAMQEPMWSPDGSKFAFWCIRSGLGEEGTDIYVMDADGSNVKRLTDSPAYDLEARWSPDGTRILFDSDRSGNYELYIMDADGSNIEKLTNTPEDEWCPDWTAFSYAVEPAGKLKSMWGKIKVK